MAIKKCKRKTIQQYEFKFEGVPIIFYELIGMKNDAHWPEAATGDVL